MAILLISCKLIQIFTVSKTMKLKNLNLLGVKNEFKGKFLIFHNWKCFTVPSFLLEGVSGFNLGGGGGGGGGGTTVRLDRIFFNGEVIFMDVA